MQRSLALSDLYFQYIRCEPEKIAPQRDGEAEGDVVPEPSFSRDPPQAHVLYPHHEHIWRHCERRRV